MTEDEKVAAIIAPILLLCVGAGIVGFAIPALINQHTDAGLYGAIGLGFLVLTCVVTAGVKVAAFFNSNEGTDNE